MNTTTFTIESVHGVKQTLVLGILDRSAIGQTANDKPGQVPSKPGSDATQAASQSTR